MNRVRSSSWRKALFVLATALMATQCGGDDSSSGDKDEAKCRAEDLTAGTYAFNLTGISDNCANEDLSQLLEYLGYVQSGPYSIDLPGYQQLLAGPVQLTAALPFVGTRTGTLTLSGDNVGLSVPTPVTVHDIDIPMFQVVDITVTLAGTFCTKSDTRVDAEFYATITNVEPPVITPCVMTFRATGTR